MSGIVAAWNRGGQGGPGERLRKAIDRAMALLAHRGGDGEGVAVLDWGAGVGQHSWHTTPEDSRVKMPWSAPDGSLRLVLDGRLDNRDELVEAPDAGEAFAVVGRHRLQPSFNSIQQRNLALTPKGASTRLR